MVDEVVAAEERAPLALASGAVSPDPCRDLPPILAIACSSLVAMSLLIPTSTAITSPL